MKPASDGGSGSLFDPLRSDPESVPLAERMRPTELSQMVGQPDLLDQRSGIRALIDKDSLPSLILWGPPGSGKTTLARVIANKTRRSFQSLSAVLGGVADLRKLVKEAEEIRRYQGKSTILFVDEIHRFNKSQQDAFLPHLENGTITLIGATTENPSFSVNAAVLSRCKVLRLVALEKPDLVALLQRALSDERRGLGKRRLSAALEVLESIAQAARGDARRALGLLETAALLCDPNSALERSQVERALDEQTLLYDKTGDEHYNTISAFIKAMRGSDPDAAIYYLMRMLEAGDDPLFLLRRMLIFASEDVGNADPRALSVAVSADAAFRRVGMPEGIYPIAHACLYLASCPKSNAVGKAWMQAKQAVHRHGNLEIPNKLRNAATTLMKEFGYGDGYQHPHDFAENHAPGEQYLPDALQGTRFYEPSTQGLEQAIKERLERLRGQSSK